MLQKEGGQEVVLNEEGSSQSQQGSGQKGTSFKQQRTSLNEALSVFLSRSV